MPMHRADKTLDIQGLAGTRPVMVTRDTLQKMGLGQTLMVIANDKRTRQSIPELCEGLGCRLLDFSEEAGTLYFVIQK